MQTYRMDYDSSDMGKAVRFAFSYMESLDEIVGSVYVSPSMAKRIVLSMSDEVRFDYVPEGIGMLRTAYLKYMPSTNDNELRFVNQGLTVELRLYLI